MLKRMNFDTFELIIDDDHNAAGQYSRENLEIALGWLNSLSAVDSILAKSPILTPNSPADMKINAGLFFAIQKFLGVLVYNDTAVELDFTGLASGIYYNVEVRSVEVEADPQTRNFIDSAGNTFQDTVNKRADYSPEFNLNPGTGSAAPPVTVGYIKLGEVFWNGTSIESSNIKNVDNSYGEGNTGWTTEPTISQLVPSYGEHRNTFDHPDGSISFDKLNSALQDLILAEGATTVPSDTLHGEGLITNYRDQLDIVFKDTDIALNGDEGKVLKGGVLVNESSNIIFNEQTDTFEFTPTDPARVNSLDTRIQVGKTVNVDYEVVDFTTGVTQPLRRVFDTDSGETGVADGTGAGTDLEEGPISPEVSSTEVWDDTGVTQYTITFDGGNPAADFSFDTTTGEITKQNGAIIGNIFQAKYVYSLDRYDTVEIIDNDSIQIKEGTYTTEGVPEIVDPDIEERGLWIIKISANDSVLSVANKYEDIRQFLPKVGEKLYFNDHNKWLNIESKQSLIWGTENLDSYGGNFVNFTDMRGVIKNPINDLIIALNNGGHVIQFPIPELGAAPIEDAYFDVTGNTSKDLLIAYDGDTPYLIISDYNATIGGPALRLIEIDPETGDLLSLLPNPVNSNGRRYAYGITVYNNNIYVAFEDNNNATGKRVEKTTIAEAVIEANGGAVAVWTTVLDMTALGTVDLEYLTVDTNTGIFYVFRGGAVDQVYAFIDDGNPTNYDLLIDYGVNTGKIFYYEKGGVYLYANNSFRIRRLVPLDAYTGGEVWDADDVLENNISYNPGNEFGLFYFSVAELGNLDILMAVVDDRLYIYSHDTRYKVIKKATDNSDSQLSFVIDKKAHIVENEWDINSLREGIDMNNFIAGRVDGLQRRKTSQYILWAFADADDHFVGFGLTRRPTAFYSAAIDYTIFDVGESFTLTIDQFDDFPNDLGDSNIVSTFTIGSHVVIQSSFNNWMICEVIGLNIGLDQMSFTIIGSSNNQPTAVPGVGSNNWIWQIDNFKPYINGGAQSLYAPKYKMISTAVNTNSVGTIVPMVCVDGKCLYGNGFRVNIGGATGEVVTLNYWVIPGQGLIAGTSIGSTAIRAWDLHLSSVLLSSGVSGASGQPSHVGIPIPNKWSFVFTQSTIWDASLYGWVDDIDDTKRR